MPQGQGEQGGTCTVIHPHGAEAVSQDARSVPGMPFRGPLVLRGLTNSRKSSPLHSPKSDFNRQSLKPTAARLYGTDREGKGLDFLPDSSLSVRNEPQKQCR